MKTGTKPTQGQVACDGCGLYHGSVNDAARCMRETLAAVRAKLLKTERLAQDAVELLAALREMIK